VTLHQLQTAPPEFRTIYARASAEPEIMPGSDKHTADYVNTSNLSNVHIPSSSTVASYDFSIIVLHLRDSVATVDGYQTMVSTVSSHVTSRAYSFSAVIW
jgi:hypothetical protein